MDEWQGWAERVTKAVACLLVKTTSDGVISIASGTLVRLGGVEFVFTAGHNVWDKDAHDFSIVCAGAAPIGVNLQWRPDSVERTFVAQPASGDPDPDVAVLELSSHALLRSDRLPFEEEELGHLDPNSIAAGALVPLVLAGFPLRRAQLREDQPVFAAFSEHHPIDAYGAVVAGPCLLKARAPEEPAGGRGVHMWLHDGVGDPKGMSGGPLYFPERRQLVGLARSKRAHPGGVDEWCEPVVEAVALLRDHPTSAVSVAARRVVERLRVAH